MSISWALLLFAMGTTAATPDGEVAWYSAPNFRGTWDLIVSCVLTLVICVWSALHLNVPIEQSRLRDRNIRRFRWVLLGIFAPEIVVSTAFAQFLTARWLRNEIRADTKYRNRDRGNKTSVTEKERISEEWSISQCYFAVMGGIAVETGDYVSNATPLTITAEEHRSITATTTSPDASKLEAVVPKFHSTRFSLGSIGAKNPLKFLGPLQKFQDVNGEVQYTYKCDKVAVEHEEFFQLQGPDHCLQHTQTYCRKTFQDCKDHAPLSGQAKQRWSLANDIVQELWNECGKRKEYTKVFFTWSTLGIFVGEPIYVADHVPNFPGFSYLGSVNVQRDILKTVVAFAGAAYGGLHLSAWNDYFPTRVERIIWIACCCTTGLTGFVLALFFLATNKLQQLEAIENRMRNNKSFERLLKGVLVPLFLTARIFIVVEAFISLRRQPEAVYQTPEWSNYFPHL